MAEYWHITWSTHNSRISHRMMDYHVKSGMTLWLGEQEEIFITETIAETVRKNGCRIYAYNICKDHVHMLIQCSGDDIANTIRMMKSKSAWRYREYLDIDPRVKFDLWSGKFNRWFIKSEEQFNNTVMYIIRNRQKHGFPENKGLPPVILEMIRGCGNIIHAEEYENEIRYRTEQRVFRTDKGIAIHCRHKALS